MSWFQNLSIRSKVMTAFAAVLAVTVVLGVFSITRLSIVNDGAITVSDNYLVASNGLSDLAANAMRYRQLQASYLLMNDATVKATRPRVDGHRPGQYGEGLGNLLPHHRPRL